MYRPKPQTITWIGLLTVLVVPATNVDATELIKITPENAASLLPAGKEVDAIYGDWLLRNERVTVVIGQAKAGRNANMTVRGVGGMVIDMTRRQAGSDQLSCFYPTGGRYLFDTEQSLLVLVDGQQVDLKQKSNFQGARIEFQVTGKPLTPTTTEALVRYQLSDDRDELTYQVTIVNRGEQLQSVTLQDTLRCDGTIFNFGTDEASRLFFAEDAYFGQCYGFVLDQGVYERAADKRTLLVCLNDKQVQDLPPGGQIQWSGKLYCSQGLPGVRSWAEGLSTKQLTSPVQVQLQSPQGKVAHARISFFRGDELLGTVDSNADGIAKTELLPGEYRLSIESLGRDVREHNLTVAEQPLFESLSLAVASRVQAAITDSQNQPIPAKVQFLGLEGTPQPNFGPDAAVDAIKNVVYCSLGKFEQPIAPGKYQVIISRGPEYDADKQEIEVRPGQLVQLKSVLTRSVDTRGWISSDFHSHSSPSGDNVSAQTGRVLNLLAEHIEFAPCTEHNRIDTYADDLALLKANRFMATCTGMELTGSPLPINHQNAFPLHRHEHHQDGGGPVTDADPVKQIERLALWDSASAKVLQTNHPNIPQILGDRDLNGKPDEGFRGMLGWMDVIEVHPPEGIFNPPTTATAAKDYQLNPIFFWLQLLNLGYRIPGVVNTDAHCNFHGSGWLRNYMECSTDDPAEIKIDEMIHVAEHGHMVMTTGPFLEAQVRTERAGKAEYYIAGEDVVVGTAPAKVWIRVQCPNWFDINRVQVFANGRPVAEMNFSRKSHPMLFSQETVRFETEVALPKFDRDTHLIVATIGEGLTLGPVMGEDRGKVVPAAVTNPIFIDVDGSGFKANGDDLGIPVMLPRK